MSWEQPWGVRPTGHLSVLLPSVIKPRLHPTVSSGRIGDPNGAVWWKGAFHLFHQQNTTDPRGGASSWGHLTSTDLAHWVRHPTALEPRADFGEEHIFSGSARELPDGRLGLLFTVIYGGGRLPEQHLAVADLDGAGNLVVDRTPGAVMTSGLHGGLDVEQWRDPFLLEERGSVFAVTGGSIVREGEPRGSVLLYRCHDRWLREWTFEGVLFQHPEPAAWNIECPNFFPLADAWVLLISPHDCPQYFVGAWDHGTNLFQPVRTDTLDSGALYATQILRAPGEGQADILLGWIRTLPVGASEGWSGCHAFPRRLSLSPSKTLRQTVDPSVRQFRAGALPEKFSGQAGDAGIEAWFDETAGEFVELEVGLGLEQCGGFDLHWGSEAGSINFHFDKGKGLLWVDGRKRWTGPGRSCIRLRVFLDRCALEIFEEESGTAWTLVKPELTAARREMRGKALGGTLRWEASAWRLEPAGK